MAWAATAGIPLQPDLNVVATRHPLDFTHPCEARQFISRLHGSPCKFQSTRPCGARRLNSNSFGFCVLAWQLREPSWQTDEGAIRRKAQTGKDT